MCSIDAMKNLYRIAGGIADSEWEELERRTKEIKTEPRTKKPESGSASPQRKAGILVRSAGRDVDFIVFERQPKSMLDEKEVSEAVWRQRAGSKRR